MSDGENTIKFRCRTPTETIIVKLLKTAVLGDLLKEIATQTKTAEQAIEIQLKNKKCVPVDKPDAKLVDLGLGDGGGLVITINKAHTVGVFDAMFAHLMPPAGTESETFTGLESNFMQAHTRAMKFGYTSTQGLGMGTDDNDTESESRLSKPDVKGLITSSIATMTTLNDKKPTENADYKPAVVTKDSKRRRRDRSRSRSRSRERDRRKRSRSRERGKKKQTKRKQKRGRKETRGREEERSRTTRETNEGGF